MRKSLSLGFKFKLDHFTVKQKTHRVTLLDGRDKADSGAYRRPVVRLGITLNRCNVF